MDSSQGKDLFMQRCILDSLLSQPIHRKSSELMRNPYTETNQSQFRSRRMPLGQPISALPSAYKSILSEHCYARPFDWQPESTFLRPTRTLFMKVENCNDSLEEDSIDDNVDVVSREIDPPVNYDVINAKNLMEECERHVIGVREGSDWEEWEEKVPKIHWSRIQHNLFNSIVQLLDHDRMARLAYMGHKNEPTLRRTIIDKSVSRFRLLMAKYIWDVKLVQWLHGLLIDYMSGPYLAVYLDLLQTLYQKLPTFVDKLIKNPDLQPSLYPALNPDKIEQLICRSWNPSEQLNNNDKPKPLPGSPIILLIPSAPIFIYNKHSKRMARWVKLFSNYGIVVTVQNPVGCNRKMTVNECADHIIFTIYAKFEEIKAEHPDKRIVLVAFNSSCPFAMQLAQAENVVCVINMGFSIYTPTGIRGKDEDNILDLHTPILFVIGQLANTTFEESIQDLRERMKIETGLLIVGGADDYLRVNTKVKRAEGITQSMADRYIADEAADFINGILQSPYPPKMRTLATPIGLVSDAKRMKTDRKRTNSNGSSLDSEPPSPTPRNIRTGKIQQPMNISGIYGFNKTGIRTIPPNPAKQIKLLDNITITPGTTGKIINRPDLQKISPSPSPIPNYTNTLINIPEGRMKASPMIRGTSPLTKLLTSKPFIPMNPNTHSATRPPTARTNLTKFITTKRQMPPTNRPKQIRKVPTYLPPPTNLTSQDIMDLPIIFADDNQMLTNDTIQPSDVVSPSITPTPQRTASGKVMILNKTFSPSLSHHTVKRTITKIPQNIRLKKIVMTKPQNDTKQSLTTFTGIPLDIDLEGELIANTIAKKYVPGQIVDTSYKTEVMSPSLITTKIKQAIEDNTDVDILNDSM